MTRPGWRPARTRPRCTGAPLADGAGYDWAEPYAETARRRALDAWTTIAELLEPADPDQALAALETALGHDPFNEYLYQRIMRLQAAAGRPERGPPHPAPAGNKAHRARRHPRRPDPPGRRRAPRRRRPATRTCRIRALVRNSG